MLVTLSGITALAIIITLTPASIAGKHRPARKGVALPSFAAILPLAAIAICLLLVDVVSNTFRRLYCGVSQSQPWQLSVHCFHSSRGIRMVQVRTVFGRRGSVSQTEKLYIYSAVAEISQPPYTMPSAPQ